MIRIKTAIVLVITLTLVGCMAMQWRSTAVRDRLAATDGLGTHEISINEMRRGSITLNGSVSSERDRDVIERVARETSGVNEVLNNLVVTPSFVVVQGADAQSPRNASATVAAIMAELASAPELRDYNLNVAVVDDIVTLRGEVSDERARTAAESIARNAHGVKYVRNEIVVRRPNRSDLQISQNVRDALLRSNSNIDLRNVDITTRNGIVTFMGSQNSHYDVDRILAMARSVDGVRGVRNELTVNPVRYDNHYRGRR